MWILLNVSCCPVPTPRSLSWVTTTSGRMREPSSTCLLMPSTGIRVTTTKPWTTTSCWWSWHTRSMWTSMSNLSLCHSPAPQPGICALCLVGETSIVIKVIFFDLSIHLCIHTVLRGWRMWGWRRVDHIVQTVQSICLWIDHVNFPNTFSFWTWNTTLSFNLNPLVLGP